MDMSASTTASQLMAILRSAFHKDSINPESIDWAAVLQLARAHSVLNVVAYAFLSYPEEKRPEGRIYQHLHKFLCGQVAQSVSQEHAASELETYFEKHQLYVLPMKGVVTRNRYPDSVLRSMGDLDLLCRPEQNKEIRRAMDELGYTGFQEGRTHDHYTLSPFVKVEMHREMVAAENQYSYYYDNIWDRCKPKDGFEYVYEMSLEDEYIFNLVHLVRHFKAGGAGIRFFMDVYVYERIEEATGEKLDRGYLETELQKLGLLEFYRNIRTLSLHWFGSDKERQDIEMTAVLEELESYILSGGTFGSSENAMAVSAERGRAATWLKACFPSYKSMKSMFPWLKRYPFLLPYSWLLRAVRAVKYRRDNISVLWNMSVNGDSNKGKEIKKLMQDVGL